MNTTARADTPAATWNGSLTRPSGLWKSTEHNIDLYGAFTHLQQHRAAGDPDWSEAAAHTRQFVEGMWNEADGFYWTGTVDDGVSHNQQAIPLDTQTGTMQAFSANTTLPHHGVRHQPPPCHLGALRGL